MKTVFSLVALISALIGAITLIAAFYTWNLMVLISGIFALTVSYAWSLVGEMSEKLEALERKVNRIGA